MITNNEIVARASQFVFNLLRDKLPTWAVYHNYNHTVETVDAVKEIGEASKLSKAEMDVVLLAAWFHDTGYIEGFEGHEARSVEIASRFLQEQGYPPERIDQIAGCITATKMPQNPKNLVEQVLCDADMAHLGKKRFFEKSDLIRLEFERRLGKTQTDLEWLNSQVDFLSRHQFYTKYAREEFSKRSVKNLNLLQEHLRDAATVDQESKVKLEQKKEKLVLYIY